MSQTRYEGSRVLTVVSVIVFIGIALLIGYLRNKATKALTQKVFNRGNHAKGQSATKEQLDFLVPVSADEVRRAVRDRLGLTNSPGALIAQLYLAQDEPGFLTFAFGNKLGEAFRSVLTFDDTPQGARVTYKVLSWVEGDGIVRGIPEMQLLANSVRACAADLGATYGASPAVAAIPVSAVTISTVSVPEAAHFCTACGSGYLGSAFCTDCGASFVAG